GEVATHRRTYALTLSYDGAPFRGWQRQPGLPTVQQALEDALAELLGERVQVHGAARTDAGVHAEGQVASFVVRHVLSPGSLSRLRLPPGLVVSGTAEAQPEFHARSSAAGKRYRYRFAAGSPLAWDLGARTPATGSAPAPHWMASAGFPTWPASLRPRAEPGPPLPWTNGAW
ncbi:MAG TPA: tRNA pseudouridine synthase A, partial [Myxococcales bacterium]|nr:tRNA pseudouridine synthase A [Myxococcales bacterium]